jgi:putative transcriptional regulator
MMPPRVKTIGGGVLFSSHERAFELPDLFDLTGKILIATPGLVDDRFSNSVIVVCAHSHEGAMGLMVNKPAEQVTSAELFDQLSLPLGPVKPGLMVYAGGPVEMERGFVLHSPDYSSAISTLAVTEALAMTATLDILEDIAEGQGPDQSLLALGYCGWGAGQLEGEISENGWLIGDALPELVFAQTDSRKWELALAAQGIHPLTLSSAYGHA